MSLVRALVGRLPHSLSGRVVVLVLSFAAGVQLLAEQRAAFNGVALPPFSIGWLVGAVFCSFWLVPSAPRKSSAISLRAIAILGALLLVGVAISATRARALDRPGPGFVASTYVLDNDAWLPQGTVALSALGFESRRELARATGRRRDTKLVVDATLHAPEAGDYALGLDCDDRCLVAIDDRAVADSARDSEFSFPLTRGRHAVAFEYVQRDGPAYAELRWRRPVWFAFLPLDHYLGDARYVPSSLSVFATFAASLAWWVAFIVFIVGLAESRRGIRTALHELAERLRSALSRAGARVRTRRRAWGAWGTRLAIAGFVLGTSFAFWALVDTRVRVSVRQGDWRSVVEGAQLAGNGEILGAGARAFVHFHDLDGRPGSLELELRSVGDGPVLVETTQNGRRERTASVGPRGETLRFRVEQGARFIDVGLEAVSPVAAGALYHIEDVRLIRDASLRYYALALLVLSASFAVALTSARRASVWGAVLDGLLTALLGTWVLAFCFDPVRLDEIVESLRIHGRVACLALVWLRVFVAAPSRSRTGAAVIATVLLLYLPALRYGFVTDDFLFGRPMTWRQTLSTLVGHWDPFGVANDHYRPMIALSFALDYVLWNASPSGWHATNLMVHVLNGMLAVGLLGTIGLPRKAAVLGALAWCAHPLGATAASWANERTDGILILFYLACLIFLLSPRFGRWQVAGALATGALALGSKELAVTLPVVAGLSILLVRELEARRLRYGAVAALTMMVVAYVAFWRFLFPEKAAGATGLALSSSSAAPDGWLQHPFASLYSSVFAPADYRFWQSLQFGSETGGVSAAYFLLGPALWALAFAWLRYRTTRVGGDHVAARAALLGGAWPAITALPLLGLSGGIDLFRLGWLSAFGFALTWAALLSGSVERRTKGSQRWLGALAATGLALWFGFSSIASSSAWSPNGFMATLGARWSSSAAWRSKVSPEMLELFDSQAGRVSHARAWVRQEPDPEPPP